MSDSYFSLTDTRWRLRWVHLVQHGCWKCLQTNRILYWRCRCWQ